MTIEQSLANIPVNCRPGELVTVAGEYYCFMCAQNGPIGHVSLSKGIHDRAITIKRFAAGEKFDSSCPEHGSATGWTIGDAKIAIELDNSLFKAIESCNSDIVFALIEKGADVNARKSDGSTALMLAVSTGCDDVVQILLLRGAEVNVWKSDGTTALMIAAKSGNVNVLRLLLGNGAEVNAKKNDNGTTSLEIAASDGNIEIVRALVAKGANVNAVNYSGHTALICAGLKGHLEVVEFLKSLKM